RRVFGLRARTLGFAPRVGESDDDQLLRQSLLRFVAPEDPRLAAQARRLTRAWIRDRKVIDRGLVEAVLFAAARTGDATLFDAMAARVDRDAPGGWPMYARGLCSDDDHRLVEEFWRPRAQRFAGAERNLAQSLEAIAFCGRLRGREAGSVAAFLAKYCRCAYE